MDRALPSGGRSRWFESSRARSDQVFAPGRESSPLYITRSAGTLARRHRKAFSGIDDADYLIAATALVLDAELLTTNVRHFPMLSGLRSAY